MCEPVHQRRHRRAAGRGGDDRGGAAEFLQCLGRIDRCAVDVVIGAECLWAQRLRRAVTSSPAPAVELRMLVTQLYLDLLAAGVWGPDDDDWCYGFAQVLAAMPPTDADDIPERGQPYVGGLVAVGLALLGQDATLHGGRPRDLLQRAWDAAGKWAAYAEPALVDHYLYQPAQSYSRVADRGEVDAVIALADAARDDPDAQLRAAFASEGIDVERVGGAWVADCGSSQPRRYAARIATLVGAQTASYVVAVHGDRGRCILLSHQNSLAIAESTTKIWRLFTKRTALSTPTSMLADGLPSGTSLARKPGAPLPQAVAELAAAIGIDAAHLNAAL